jgi:hypothetical protein
MIKISEKHLMKAIEKVNGLDTEKYTKFIESFAKKQPELLTYMLVSAESLSDPGGRDDLIYILSVFWEAYLSLNVPIGKITNKEIEKREIDQISGWEKLANMEDDTKEATFTKKFISQPNLWDFMNEIVLPDAKGKTNFKKDDDVALTYACVNLAISLLNDKVKKGASKN